MRTGCFLFTITCALYCAFWGLGYSPAALSCPTSSFRKLLTVILFFLTLVFGIISIFFIAQAISASSASKNILKFAVAAVLLYATLAITTKNFMHRIITTELVLIVFVTFGFLLAVSSLPAGSQDFVFFSSKKIAFYALIGVVFLISVMCYLFYYRVEQKTAFILGFVPLAGFGLTSLAISLLS